MEELPDGVYRSGTNEVPELLGTDELIVRVDGESVTIAYSTFSGASVEVAYRLVESR